MELGLYEQIVSKDLANQLDNLSAEITSSISEIDKAEASAILAAYVSQQAQTLLEYASEQGLEHQVNLINRMIAATELEPTQSIYPLARQLLSLADASQDGVRCRRSGIIRSETSVPQSSLFTGSQHESQLETELNKEIASADCIDMLVSFIRWSGLRLLMRAQTSSSTHHSCSSALGKR